MININNIFSLFSSNDDLDGNNNTPTHIDFTNSPVYWVGMYKKLIVNHISFNTKVIQFFKMADHEFDSADMKEASEFITYNRAWSYISQVDPNIQEHLDAIYHYSDEHLDTALKLGINYFEQSEQYERCALLHKILLSIENFQKKLGD